MPPGVFTVIEPVAPAPGVAVILLDDVTVKDCAAIPPNSTAVALSKLLPEMVTTAFCPSPIVVKPVIIGAGIKTNPGNTAVPPGPVTVMLPLAPYNGWAVICVGDTIVKFANEEPKFTCVTLVKFVPVMVTVVGEPAVRGLADVIVGAGYQVNPANCAVPAIFVIETLPVAPAPTVT
jgi:hypothetical protein